ncbi:hypothetical protein KOAAANKH_00782 [Brevundimonas sp. NIBR10]|nr:hypothetical protein KOAAANKH_00782 [Brevundimonas sp. NIBR10]
MEADTEPTTRQGRGQARRQTLLKTARALFVAQGLHDTGMAQIATVSGIRTQQIYRDFQNKAEIIACVFERESDIWLDEPTLQAALDAGDADGARRWIFQIMRIGTDVDQPRLLAEIIFEGARNPLVSAVNRRLERNILARLEAAIALIAPGEDRSERRAVAASTLLTLSFGATLRCALNSAVAPEEMTRQVHALVERELEQIARD